MIHATRQMVLVHPSPLHNMLDLQSMCMGMFKVKGNVIRNGYAKGKFVKNYTYKNKVKGPGHTDQNRTMKNKTISMTYMWNTWLP